MLALSDFFPMSRYTGTKGVLLQQFQKLPRDELSKVTFVVSCLQSHLPPGAGVTHVDKPGFGDHPRRLPPFGTSFQRRQEM